MTVFKCKMCAGDLDVAEGQTTAECRYCGTMQTLPRLDDDRRANLYDRANHFRRNNEFDKAAGIYEQILAEDPDDAEAYWSRVLCRYGIEYVEDPKTHKRVPTVNRAQYTSIFDDEDYKAAVAKGDGAQQALYKEEAAAINEIQKGILEISSKEEPFDVFICYKETDESGRRTQDSVLANDLYHQLTQEGFKVFFSRITLEDKLGSAYEPYIFAALNSAKVMVVLGTRPEYFKAVWVRNEWSRYLALIKDGAKKALIPAYRDMDPYDLPEEFSHLQAQDMSKLGFMQDLVRGIRKIAAPEEKAAATVVVQGGGSGGDTAALLKRAYMFLEDGEWSQAREYCERVLDADPENAEAYLGELMAETNVRRREALRDVAEPFDGRDKCVKAVRFGDQELRNEVEAANEHIRKRNEQARLDGLYEKAEASMEAADSEESYLAAAVRFDEIADHKDAGSKAKACRERAEECAEAVRAASFREAEKNEAEGTISSLGKAVEGFKALGSYNGADARAEGARRKLDAAKKKAAGKAKRIAVIAGIVVVAIIAVLVVTQVVEREAANAAAYEEATSLYESGDYAGALAAFNKLGNYKDSEGQAEAAQGEIDKLKVVDGALDGAKVGDMVLIGTYEQDNDTSNGAEDIEWRVLAVEDGKVLLISEYALDAHMFNSMASMLNDWDRSDLKSWLTGDFKSDAFTSDDASCFNGDLFCLSVEEAYTYFLSDADRMCAPTAYAVAQGAWQSDDHEVNGRGACLWWLRSAGRNSHSGNWLRRTGGDVPSCGCYDAPRADSDSYHAALVYADGDISLKGYYVRDVYAVRPALWVNL